MLNVLNENYLVDHILESLFTAEIGRKLEAEPSQQIIQVLGQNYL